MNENVPAEIDPLARAMIERYVDDFSRGLTIEAAYISRRRRSRIVSPEDVLEAERRIISSKYVDRKNDLSLIAGSILMGAAFQGLTEGVINGSTVRITVYLIQGTLGLTLTLRSLLR